MLVSTGIQAHNVDLLDEECDHSETTVLDENEQPASCTDPGSYDEVVYCVLCGQELSRNPIEIPAMGHIAGTPYYENVQEPTCTEDGGQDEVICCEMCGMEMTREWQISPALGHDWGAVEEITPTCTEPGREQQTCLRCFDTFVINDYPPFGHEMGSQVKENLIEPTETQEGSYDMVTYCDRCGEELEREHFTIPVATAIQSITAEENEDQTIYSITGQRLSKPMKGINIVGGKKILVK